MDPKGCAVVFKRKGRGWGIEEVWNYYNQVGKNSVEAWAKALVRKIVEGEGERGFYAIKQGPDWGCIHGKIIGKNIIRE